MRSIDSHNFVVVSVVMPSLAWHFPPVKRKWQLQRSLSHTVPRSRPRYVTLIATRTVRGAAPWRRREVEDHVAQAMTAVPPAYDAATASDAWLFGWDPLPGIVSVWADRNGRALVWQRTPEGVTCFEDRYRPWLYAAGLDDLRHLGGAVAEATAGIDEAAPFTYRVVDGPEDSLRYVLSACDGRTLQRAILSSARSRLGRDVRRVADLPNQYYQVGAVEQYLMASGKVCFRGMTYADVHRLQFDLETTSLSPRHGRIFLVAVRDSSRAGDAA